MARKYVVQGKRERRLGGGGKTPPPTPFPRAIGESRKRIKGRAGGQKQGENGRWGGVRGRETRPLWRCDAAHWLRSLSLFTRCTR